MALIIADRVKETSSTNGAGNITLSGAVTGFQSFSSAVGVGNTCYYVIENTGAGEWEVGVGTISDTTTLVRTTVLKSSNNNSVVTFTTGTKNVFVSFPADEIIGLATLNDVETLTNKTLSTNTTWNGNVIPGQYGGTGIANTGKTITINGNLTTANSIGYIFGTGNSDLGNGTGSSTNVLVQALGSNFTSVSSGPSSFGSTVLALKRDSTLWAWGKNYNGQIGDNTITTRTSPVQVVTGGSWSVASVGSSTSAGIKTDGTLWLWGVGTSGQLGDNTIVSKSSPVQTIAGGVGWTSVSAGGGFTLALKTNTLWAFGVNTSGQFGDDSITSRSSPIQVGSVNTWSYIHAGVNHAAGIKTDGTLWLWGDNTNGKLGDNTTTPRSSPIQTIAGGTTWSTVHCGNSITSATKTDGTLWVWGPNQWGQLGDNTTTPRSSPIQTIARGTNWISSASTKGGGGVDAVALKSDGTLWGWGRNLTGIVGDGTNTARSSPVQMLNGPNAGWNMVTAGYASMYVSTANSYVNLIPQGSADLTLPISGTLATLSGIESLTNKTMSTNTTWNGNIIPGQYGGTGIANTGRTITIGGNFTTSGAFTTTLTSTANTSVILPTTGTLATLAGIETFSNKTVNLAAGNATTAPLKFVTGTNMTTAAAGNMEFNGTRLFFTPSTTRQTVAFLTDITGGLTVADDTSTAATRYLIFTNATSGSVSTANTSSSKLFFNPATGDLTAGGSITALSDRTLKNNITTITGAVDKVNSLRGVEFDWVDSGDHSVGVIAQEVEDVIPEVVLTHKGLKSVAYGNLIAVLIEAIKDQDKRIKLLEALVERLVK